MLGNPVGALWGPLFPPSLSDLSPGAVSLLLYCLRIINPAFLERLSRLTFVGRIKIENSLSKDETSWVRMDTDDDKIRLMESPPWISPSAEITQLWQMPKSVCVFPFVPDGA